MFQLFLASDSKPAASRASNAAFADFLSPGFIIMAANANLGTSGHNKN